MLERQTYLATLVLIGGVNGPSAMSTMKPPQLSLRFEAQAACHHVAGLNISICLL